MNIWAPGEFMSKYPACAAVPKGSPGDACQASQVWTRAFCFLMPGNLQISISESSATVVWACRQISSSTGIKLARKCSRYPFEALSGMSQMPTVGRFSPFRTMPPGAGEVAVNIFSGNISASVFFRLCQRAAGPAWSASRFALTPPSSPASFHPAGNCSREKCCAGSRPHVNSSLRDEKGPGWKGG